MRIVSVVIVLAWMLPCARVSSMDAGGEWRRHIEHLRKTERITARHGAVSEALTRRANFLCGDCMRIYHEFDAELMEISKSSTASIAASDPYSAERALEKYLNDWDALCAKYENIAQGAPGDTLCGKCTPGRAGPDLHQSLTAEFGDPEKARTVQRAYEEARAALMAARQAFETALSDPEHKKKIDGVIRRFYGMSGDIPREFYEHFHERMRRTLDGLEARGDRPDLNIKNPYASPNQVVQKHAQGEGYAFISTSDPEQRLFLKNGFFGKLDIKEQAATIIHEQSHVSAGTVDVGSYGYWENRWLKSHQEAFSNADSFAYLVWDVAKSVLR